MDFSKYQSPFTWRYGSEEMRTIWSEENKRHIWRKLWVALAEIQAEYGITSQAQVQDLIDHANQINIARALEIEAEIHHDLMAEIKTFAEQCPVGGGIIHLGATSMDIIDNADALRVQQSLIIIKAQLEGLITSLLDKVETYAATPMIAMTHIQPAEPSTLGYRLAMYAQDLLADWEQISNVAENYKAKGFKGAVGTAAAYTDLIGLENISGFESKLSQKLGIEFFPVTTQTYPRKQDLHLINTLASLGASLYKFAFDLRILQSPPFGELSEPFKEKQVGSSAMPFKRNPINAEKLNSLGRLLAQMPRTAWDNAAHSLLERTLDDSANRRILLPETFLLSDEMLRVTRRVVDGLEVNQNSIRKNLETYAPFAATERVLIAAVKNGADRQEIHEVLRQHSLKAWDAVQQGKPNPLSQIIAADEHLKTFLDVAEITALMDAGSHTGIAESRARDLAKRGRHILEID
ncbi:MAG: adenylosuccinate lyase [Anaerolineales bacterium]|nr:adenylosuccinate lyase [Anaerolineales bacterium]